MPDLAMFVPITKVDAVQRLVYGSLASETPDRSNEVFDYETSKPLVEAWSGDIKKATDGKSEGNLRAMHSKIAAGKFTSVVCNDATKSVDVCAKVVDDAEWTKVQEGVYTGFSVGGEYVKKWKDPRDATLTRYTAKPAEGSLVDLPCNPGSSFVMVKADGVEELRKFHAPAVEPTPTPAEPAELEQVWKAKDGSTFATKALAKAHNDEVAKAAADAKEPANQLAAALADASAAVAKVEAAQAAAPVVEAPAVAPVAKRAMRLAKALKGDLKKGLYSVCQLADLVQQLSWLQDSAEYEAASEGDGSTMPATLKASVAALCAALVAMVQEETAELLADPNAPTVLMLDTFEMSAHVGSLVKVLGDKAPAALVKAAAAPAHGDADAKHLANAHDSVSAMGFGKCAGMSKASARFSKPVADNLQKAHDHLMKAGAPCKGKPAEADDAKDDDAPADDEKTEKLAKALEDSTAKNVSLEKTLTDAVVTVKSLVERVQKLEAQPMPRPHERPVDPRYTVVDKGADDASAALAQLTEVAKSDPQAIAKALLKLSFQHPHTIG